MIDAPTIAVPCERCSASGRRPLNRKEAETLAAIGGDWETTGAIAPRLGRVARTALLYRLAHLEALGLIESRRARGECVAEPTGYGNEKLWRRKPPAESPP